MFVNVCVCVVVCVCTCLFVVTDLSLKFSWPSQNATFDRSGNCTSIWKNYPGRFYCTYTQQEAGAQSFRSPVDTGRSEVKKKLHVGNCNCLVQSE